jgi:general secretion pathway protein I
MRRRALGFTLLEMMIAMAILSGSLTWIVVGMSRNIKVENHAKLMTTATFLARGKMSQFEDELYEKGFGEFDKEVDGVFEEAGFKKFRWKIIVDKVELPSSTDLQNVLSKANEAKQQLTGSGDKPADPASGGNSSSPLSMGANALASQFGIIKDVLEQGIRRVTAKVSWLEGKKTNEVVVMAYFTDPRKVDQAIQLSVPGNLPGGAPGGTPGSTTPGGTTPTTPTK